MDLSNLTYQKPEGERSTSLIFVLSGGEKKEKDFLKELIKNKTIKSLSVAFMSKKKQGLQPYQMQRKWYEIRKKGQIEIKDHMFNLDKMDKVFLLSDVDEFYPQLKKIIQEKPADDYGQWIISNPCFEIWLYYCYQNNPNVDLAKLREQLPSQRSQTLKKEGNALVAGGLNPVKAFERMQIGISNSKEHYQLDDNEIPVLFATQMHDFAQYLIDKMHETNMDYSAFLRKKAEVREQMKI